jgi:uncharacterized protein with HEPN domain
MTTNESINILKENIHILQDALYWLKRSLTICGKLGLKTELSEEEFDNMETLSGRFARVSDIIQQKVFRSIDQVELEDRGTLLDSINRAHKRNLINSVEEMREIRDLRNQIVHEYIKEDLQEVFKDILEFTPRLITICDNVIIYCEKYQ